MKDDDQKKRPRTVAIYLGKGSKGSFIKGNRITGADIGIADHGEGSSIIDNDIRGPKKPDDMD